jgi:hypothetical protein
LFPHDKYGKIQVMPKLGWSADDIFYNIYHLSNADAKVTLKFHFNKSHHHRIKKTNPTDVKTETATLLCCTRIKEGLFK